MNLANLIEPPVAEASELAMWQVDMANIEHLLIKPNAVVASDIADGRTIQGELGAIFLLRRADGLIHYDRMYRREAFGREVFAEPRGGFVRETCGASSSGAFRGKLRNR